MKPFLNVILNDTNYISTSNYIEVSILLTYSTVLCVLLRFLNLFHWFWFILCEFESKFLFWIILQNSDLKYFKMIEIFTKRWCKSLQDDRKHINIIENHIRVVSLIFYSVFDNEIKFLSPIVTFKNGFMLKDDGEYDLQVFEYYIYTLGIKTAIILWCDLLIIYYITSNFTQYYTILE